MCFLFFFVLLFFSLFFFFLGINFLLFSMVYFIEMNLISLNSSMIVMTFLLDWMSLLFMSVVLFISSMVIFYSYNYMYDDLNLSRFIMLILMFVLSMLLLIISPNMISILLGWDGLGLVSYCLVIYYQNVKSFNSGMLTVLSNRIGDVFILLTISWMLNYGGWNFIFYLDFMKNSLEMKLISLMIFIAAITKSAQIPFSSWLPAAMAAPTPVSALVHSSTLVTAGVYLLIRFSDSFSGSLFNLMLMISGMTMFMSGVGANFENDLKKIVALSTLSQLGMMLMILSMGYKYISFFHLLTHALFKSLLFLCSGLIIHNMKNIQDIRFMGSLSFQLPVTSVCFNFSNLSLCGFPFLAGFYSKDLILEMFLMENLNLFVLFMLIFSSIMTVSYTFRLIFYTMVGDFNLTSLNFLNNESWIMLFSMLNLMFMTTIGGSMVMWLIFPCVNMICLPFIYKIIPLILIIIGGVLGYVIFIMNLGSFSLSFYFIKTYLGTMMFLPVLSTYKIMKLPMVFMKVNSYLDKSWMEYFGGQGFFYNLNFYLKMIEWMQYNMVMKFLMLFYLFFIIIFMIY
uniref:NADH-ubiquinone oxidoreductase chain 5 n=2 Tax=Perga condei TaxID=32411 RepID=Q5EQN7_9HYME|nr:NADH dehydrogenase subunit 5 [Perga condei]